MSRCDDLLGEIEERLNDNVLEDEPGHPNPDTDAHGYYDRLMEVQEDLDMLMQLLDEFSPPYCIFNYHTGDGSDFGFWPDWESLRSDEDVLKVDDLSRVPRRWEGEVLYSNDHGNVTLYEYADGELVEVWAVV